MTQHKPQTHRPPTTLSPNPTGRRPRGPAHFASENAAHAFAGLPDDYTHYQLSDLVKTVGRRAGWSPALVDHFRLLMEFTRPQDWLPGAQPIVWLSVDETAHRLCISTSQVGRNERALHRLGAIAWKDSPNHRRHGHRDPAGTILEAWGINLAPSAALIPGLLALTAEASESRAELRRLRHTVTSARSRIVSAANTAERDLRLTPVEAEAWRRAALEAAAGHATASLGELDAKLLELDHLDAVLLDDLAGTAPADTASDPVDNNPTTTLETPNTPAHPETDASQGMHECQPPSNYTTNSLADVRQTVANTARRKGERVVEPIPPNPPSNPPRSGPFSIRGAHIRTFLDTLPGCIRWRLPNPDAEWPDMRDIVAAAKDAASELGISDHAWAEACTTLGRDAAAVAISIIAVKHGRNQIHSPGGYLRKMTERAVTGDLNLGPSIFGLRQTSPEGPPTGTGRAQGGGN